MSRLQEVFSSLGFSNVSTYINTGNVLFDSEKKDVRILTSKIQDALKKEFGLSLRIVLRTAQNIKSLCKKIPSKWKNDADQKTDVFFLWEGFDKKGTLDLITTREGVDTLIYVSGVIVWHLHKRDYGKSEMNKFIGTPVYKNATARNVNTVRKISELL